jgi:hypothetical protein
MSIVKVNMQNNKTKLEQIKDQYNVDLTFIGNGCVINYLNSNEDEFIYFDETLTLQYILDNFDMVADMSKLNLNLMEAQW